MKILTTANQKGGVGKTAFIVHFAWYLVEKGYKVCLIDLDTQGNASFSLQNWERTEFDSSAFFCKSNIKKALSINNNKEILFPSSLLLADIEKLPVLEASGFFKENLNNISDFFDFCLIDTPPSFGNALACALCVSDFVVSPMELDAYSIQGIQLMNSVISNVENDHLSFLGLLLSKVDNRNPTQKANKELLINTFNELVIPHQLSLRSSVSRALSLCVPVWNIKNNDGAREAKKEFLSVSEYLLNRMSNI